MDIKEEKELMQKEKQEMEEQLHLKQLIEVVKNMKNKELEVIAKNIPFSVMINEIANRYEEMSGTLNRISKEFEKTED